MTKSTYGAAKEQAEKRQHRETIRLEAVKLDIGENGDMQCPRCGAYMDIRRSTDKIAIGSCVSCTLLEIIDNVYLSEVY